jgi:hypothetical protein
MVTSTHSDTCVVVALFTKSRYRVWLCRSFFLRKQATESNSHLNLGYEHLHGTATTSEALSILFLVTPAAYTAAL